MKYKLTNTDTILREDGASIPADQKNRDYCEYLDWVNAGNTPDAPDLEPDVISITTNSNIIIGDGVDDIDLVVKGKADTLVTVNVLTGETPSTINIQLDELGNGVQSFSCETSPTMIVFSHGELAVKVRAL
jgi:hypothetical protein